MIGLILLGSVCLFGFGAVGLQSWREREPRATRVASLLVVLASLPFFLAILLPPVFQWVVLGGVAAAGMASVVLFLLPVGRADWGDDTPRARVDERDIMFARARLKPGTPEYAAYYAMRPENKAGDDKTRAQHGLLSPQAREANPLIFAATNASFGVTEALREAVDGPVGQDGIWPYRAASMSAFVKNLTRYWGAHSVGVTALQPYHVYTHIGRGSGEYGAPVVLDHRYAIAFSVEMSREMVDTGPAAPTVLESAQQYVNATIIAIQLANFIRALGYPARAHIDGNYRVIAPLVARDAGLGEIGRMGLLMTPRLGPRVRLGAVTTDLPLVPDSRSDDPSMLDFCRICKKCADNCPVRAIPHDDRREIDGVSRWRIDSDTCFRYWSVVGTDCGRCMAVCPYSYPDSWMHNGVRWALRRSGAARRFVLWMDGVFYGKEPPSKPMPGWAPIRS